MKQLGELLQYIAVGNCGFEAAENLRRVSCHGESAAFQAAVNERFVAFQTTDKLREIHSWGSCSKDQAAVNLAGVSPAGE